MTAAAPGFVRTPLCARTLAVVVLATLWAGGASAQGSAMGKEAAALPAGALKDNVALLRKHEPELKQLTQPQEPKTGS